MIDLNVQIEVIEKEIRETPYHKGTEHHIGILRARVARLKNKLVETSLKKSGGGSSYAIKKHGDATVILIGPPSSGKSTLLNSLTNAESKVAYYSFTTLGVVPGMLEYKGARIQIFDVPGLIEGASDGKGRGREVLSVARTTDLLVIMSEVNKENVIENIVSELENCGIRVNKTSPNVRIVSKKEGGILIHSNIRQDFSLDTLKDVVKEFGISNAEITLNEKISLERLFDSFLRNRVYIPAIYVINKVDLNKLVEKSEYVYVSAEKEIGLENLKERIWESLKMITIYLVDPDKKNKETLIMKNGQTLKSVLVKMGSRFEGQITRAKIWGPGSKFPGQEVSLKTLLREGMEIRFI